LSHWWGERVEQFLACLEQHAQDRALHKSLESNPYWVCAYANNQWELGADLSSDPADTSFRKAIQLAAGTVSVLDREAVCYTRVWCGYEVYVSLQAASEKSQAAKESSQATKESRYRYDMYTYVGPDAGDGEHCAVGITDGLAEADKWEGRAEKYWWENKFWREKFFPAALAHGALSFRVQRAEATAEEDRRHVLNAIAGQPNLEAQPPAESPLFEDVNEKLRGRFSLDTWRAALEQGLCMEAHGAALYASALPDLHLVFDQCEQFGDDAMRSLARSLPPTLMALVLDLRNRSLSWRSGQDLGEACMRLRGLQALTLDLHNNSLAASGAEQLSLGVAKLAQLTSLDLRLGRNSIGDEGAGHLATALAALHRLASLELVLDHNNLHAESARLLGGGIAELPGLTSLSLEFRDNRFGDEGARHFGMGIAKFSNTLISLSMGLYGNQLEDDGAGYIAKGVEQLPQLTCLRLFLDYNYFGERGAQLVKASVDKLPALNERDVNCGQGDGGMLLGGMRAEPSEDGGWGSGNLLLDALPAEPSEK